MKKNKIQILSWLENSKTKFCAGFVIMENAKKIKIASTRGNRGYIDAFQIEKSQVVSRYNLR